MKNTKNTPTKREGRKVIAAPNRRSIADKFRAAVKAADLAPKGRHTLSVHAHPTSIQLHDGLEETPLAVLVSPRGDSVSLAILADGMASALGVSVRKFDAAGKAL